MDKEAARKRRGLRTRSRIKEANIFRLCIHRTPRHIYAQIISPTGDQVHASASTVEKQVRQQCAFGGNINAASVIGQLIAERAVKAGIIEVAFDRSGFKYHGRIKALADAARENGLHF